MLKDNRGKKCRKCKKGKYKETCLMDDLSGTLHCDTCNTQVSRWEAGYINTLKLRKKD